jgi:hypothetical protein
MPPQTQFGGTRLHAAAVSSSGRRPGKSTGVQAAEPDCVGRGASGRFPGGFPDRPIIFWIRVVEARLWDGSRLGWSRSKSEQDLADPPRGEPSGYVVGRAALETVQTQDSSPASRGTTHSLSRALILGGGLRSSGLAQQLGRPILCLPQTEHKSMLDNWFDALAAVGIGLESTTVLTDDAGEKAWRRVTRVPSLRVDSAEYRGPAGCAPRRERRGRPRRPQARPRAHPDARLARHAGPNWFAIPLRGGAVDHHRDQPRRQFLGRARRRARTRSGSSPQSGSWTSKSNGSPPPRPTGARSGWVPARLPLRRGALVGHLFECPRSPARVRPASRLHPVIGRMGGGITQTEYGGSLVDADRRHSASVSRPRDRSSAQVRVIGDGRDRRAIGCRALGPGAECGCCGRFGRASGR